MSRIIAIFYLMVLSACTSTYKPSQTLGLKQINAIPIGSDKSSVIRSLGEPSESDVEQGGTKLTYIIAHKTHQIPKAIIWLDSDNKVTAKLLYLFNEANDPTNKKVIENELRLHKTVVVESNAALNAHYISPLRTFEDVSVGISFDVNTARNDEVISIFWRTPTSPDSKLGSTSEK